MSIVVVAFQVFTSSLVVHLAQKREGRTSDSPEPAANFLRSITLGQEKPLADPLICRWSYSTDSDGDYSEAPPSADCVPDRLDAAIRTNDAATFDISKHLPLLRGNVLRIHLCKTCSPDLIFFPEETIPRVEMHGIWSVFLTRLILQTETITDAYKNVRRTNDRINNTVGKKFFVAPGFKSAINLSDIQSTLLLVFNFASLIVVALWLALKAHRKVLDYFARNGALLPMVAANGKNNFYGAIWAITFVRVFAFLFAAIPLTIFAIHEYIFDSSSVQILSGNMSGSILWACSLIVSLSLATLIASIADLKHRSHITMVIYRFLPILLASLGAVLWAATFIFEGGLSPFLRIIICALPVIGMVPLFVSIVFQPHVVALVCHLLLSAGLIMYLMKENARWFAAHLEEI